MKRFALFLCAVFFVALFVACSTDAGDEPQAPAPAATPAPATYTVTFNANDGAGSMQSQTFTYGVAQALRANTFTRTGYAFAGWAKAANAGAKEWSGGESIFIEENITLYAVWVEGGAEYTVLHYKQNTALNDYDEPVKETTAGTTGANTEAKAHEYEGFTAKQFEQAAIDENGRTEVKIYYERNSCTVTFNSNGGEGAMQTQTFVYGVSQTHSLTANAFTRTGYTFVGWATTANGTKTYDDGATYAIGTENVTLYALWISTDVSLKTLSFSGMEVKVYDSATSRKETEVIKTAGTHEYYIEYQGKELTITAEKNAEKATLTLSSASVTAADSTEKDVTLTVIAEDGVTKNTYTLHTVRVFTFNDAVTAIQNRTTDVTIKMVGTVQNSSLERSYSNNKCTDSELSTALKSTTSKVSLDMSAVTGLTSIGSYAFRDCKSLTSVTIPNSVTSIGSYAFRDCKSLTSVTIPDSVTSIGNYAFYGCTSLTSVDIPNRVTSIGEYAFSYCTSLTSVVIPNRVTSIGGYAFSSCTSLTSVSIGNSVTSIGIDAFMGCTSLTSVDIPDSVTSIGNYAFSSCTSLRSVSIGNSVTSIGSSVFKKCTSLRDISIANNNTAYKDIDGVVYTKDGKCLVVCPCRKTSVDIPNSVTSIGRYAFDDCTSLTSVDIPNSVTSIGKYAFYGCRLLTSLNIPDNVTSIEKYAFYNCISLKSVTFKVTERWYYTDNNYTSGTALSKADLVDASKAANYLRATYNSKYWYRE